MTYFQGGEKKGLREIIKNTGELLDKVSTEERQETRLSHGNPTAAELKKAELYLNKYHFAFERRKGNYYNQTNFVFYCKIWHFGLKMTFLHQIF